jgi:hypothetical protein
VTRLGNGIVAFALVCALAVPGLASAAAKRGQVGGPPSKKGVGLKSSPRKSGPQPRGKPLVIATGITERGPAEIIGQASTYGVCTFVYFLGKGLGSGSCGSVGGKFEETIETNSWTWSGGFGDVEGTTTAAVASVTVNLESGGQRRTVPAILAVPSAPLLKRLRANPFGFFYTTYRGCFPPHKTVAIAHDSTGAEIGKSRGFKPPKRFGNPCAKGKR